MGITSPSYLNTVKLTTDHYEHMVECGAFTRGHEKRVELHRGTIVDKQTGEPATFSVEDYEHMVGVGAFAPPYDVPIELLQGELVMRSPIGEDHARAVIAATDWSYNVVDLKEIMIRVQAPIRMTSNSSEPEPDLVWVRRNVATDKPPEAREVQLLVEVADASLANDRGAKRSTYANAGVPDYWIVNLIDKQVEVYRSPHRGSYSERSVYRGDQSIATLALPNAVMTPSRVFGW